MNRSTLLCIIFAILLIGIVPLIYLWGWAINSSYDLSPAALAHPLRPFSRLAFAAVISVLGLGIFGYVSKRLSE